MTDIDWSKAPEGATHYNEKCAYSWLKESPLSYWCGSMWIPYSVESMGLKHLEAAIPRPAEWNGEGLPPVGVECEYFFPEGEEWRKGLCVAHHDARAVIIDSEDNSADAVILGRIRPIKTQEQKLREELIQIIWDSRHIGDGGLADAILANYELTKK